MLSVYTYNKCYVFKIMIRSQYIILGYTTSSSKSLVSTKTHNAVKKN